MSSEEQSSKGLEKEESKATPQQQDPPGKEAESKAEPGEVEAEAAAAAAEAAAEEADKRARAEEVAVYKAKKKADKERQASETGGDGDGGGGGGGDDDMDELMMLERAASGQAAGPASAGGLKKTRSLHFFDNEKRSGKDLWRIARVRSRTLIALTQPYRMGLRERKHALAAAPDDGESCLEMFFRLVQKYSLPLLVGLVLGVVYANYDYDYYQYWLGGGHCCEAAKGDVCLPPANATAEGCAWCEARVARCHWDMAFPATVFHHPVTPMFIINDMFMAFFFGLAAKEITESCMPGGSLNPVRQALNPLFATVGGVIGPVGTYFGLSFLAHRLDFFPGYTFEQVAIGWGIPTATDISLAWMVALTTFGHGHPAIDYLLLLAVADDGIGMIIIAAAYGDPANPIRPEYLLITLGAMAFAYVLRRLKVKSWWVYVLGPGAASWIGLINAHLHPALALVFVIPFMPTDSCYDSVLNPVWRMCSCKRRKKHGAGGNAVSPEEAFADGRRSKKRRPSLGMSVHGPRHANNEEVAGGEGRDAHEDHTDAHEEFHKSPLHLFHQHTGLAIDFGMFFFAWANAGVRFDGFGAMSVVVVACLLLGKVLGIMGFAYLAVQLGLPLPDGMGAKHIFTLSICAALGLTVALFVAGEAFSDPKLQAQAKMGALMSLIVAPLAIGIGKCLKVHDRLKEQHGLRQRRGRGLSIAIVGDDAAARIAAMAAAYTPSQCNILDYEEEAAAMFGGHADGAGHGELNEGDVDEVVTVVSEKEVNDAHDDASSSSFSNQDKTTLRMVFDRIDKNGDGLLQKEEVLDAVKDNDVIIAMLDSSEGTKGLLDPESFKKAFTQLAEDNPDGIAYEVLCKFVEELPAHVAKEAGEGGDAEAAPAEAEAAKASVEAEGGKEEKKS